MAGGSIPKSTSPDAAVANAQASGIAGTAGGVASTAQMPDWQKGLMGALTGNAAFGKNAPAIHQMMTQGMGLMGQQGQAAPMQQGAPPSAMPPSPGMPQIPMQGMQQNPWLRR
jgi:hypothetical protein